MSFTDKKSGKRKSKRIVALHPPFSERIPITSILQYLPAVSRDHARAISKEWNSDEMLTRNEYYFPLCNDLSCIVNEFKTTIDYRKRYITFVLRDFALRAETSTTDQDKAVTALAEDYRVFIVAKDVVTTRKKSSTRGSGSTKKSCASLHKPIVTKLFSKEGTFTKTTDSDSLLIDLSSIDFEVLSSSSTHHQSVAIEIWLQRKSDDNLTLFSTHENVFKQWEGFNSDQTVEPGFWSDFFEATPPFNFGFNHYDRQNCWPSNSDSYPWQRRSYRFVTNDYESDNFGFCAEEAQFQFQVPPAVDLSSIPEDADEDTIEDLEDAIYDEWYEINGSKIHLLRFQIKFARCRHNDYSEDDILPFTPCNLVDALKDMKWF